MQEAVYKRYAVEVVVKQSGALGAVETDRGMAGTQAAVAELVEVVQHTGSHRAAIDMCFEWVVMGRGCEGLWPEWEVVMLAEVKQKSDRNSPDLEPEVLEAIASLWVV